MHFTFQQDFKTNLKLSILDSEGRIIGVHNITRGTTTYTIDTGHLAEGIYFYTIDTEQGQLKGKFIKR